MLNLAEWLERINRFPPASLPLGLARIQQVAERLDLLHPSYHILTIGGTNGKGTTSHLAARICQAAGYKTGLFTSPHLMTFNERIRVDGTMVSDAMLCQAFEQIEVACQKVKLSHFEYVTLAAFLIYRDAKIDIAIVEVGLGGRLDATNLWDADVTVVTTIAIDHERWLGNDRESIGAEKAGIFRPHRSAVCGDRQCPQSILQKALELDASFFQLGKDFDYQEHPHDWTWRSPQ